jgi:hypothetical protein
MKNLHNWSKAVDQLVISVSELLELVYFFLKELKDIIGGLAILEFFGEWILGQVYSGVLAIVGQGYIENDIKVGRVDNRRGHGTEENVVVGCEGRWREGPEDTRVASTCWHGDTTVIELRFFWILGRTATSRLGISSHTTY